MQANQQYKHCYQAISINHQLILLSFLPYLINVPALLFAADFLFFAL